MGATIVAIVNDEEEGKRASKTRQMMRVSEERDDGSHWVYISFPALRDVEWTIEVNAIVVPCCRDQSRVYYLTSFPTHTTIVLFMPVGVSLNGLSPTDVVRSNKQSCRQLMS
jgi:L-lactate permease